MPRDTVYARALKASKETSRSNASAAAEAAAFLAGHNAWYARLVAQSARLATYAAYEKRWQLRQILEMTHDDDQEIETPSWPIE